MVDNKHSENHNKESGDGKVTFDATEPRPPPNQGRNLYHDARMNTFHDMLIADSWI